MRVIGMKKEGNWAGWEHRTTYKRGWERCLSLAHVIWDYTDNAEVLVGDIGTTPQQVKITAPNDFENIQEAGFIEVRGHSKVYDNIISQYIIYNQSDVVRMWLPTQYIEKLKKSETEHLNEDEQLHTFDRYMDSIEVNAEILRAQKAGARQVLEEFKSALLQYAAFESSGSQNNESVLMYRGYGVEINLTEIVNSIRKTDAHRNKPQSDTFAQLKLARGAIVERLMTEYNVTRSVDLPQLTALVDSLTLTEPAKEALRLRLEEMAKAVNEQGRTTYFYSSLLHLSGLTNFLNVVTAELAGNESNEEMLAQWQTSVLSELPSHITLSSDLYYAGLLKRCIYAMRWQNSEVNYPLLYTALYGL